MNDEEQFEITNRPNFELRQAIAWALSGSTTMIGASLFGVDVFGSVLLSIPSFVMMTKRMMPANNRMEQRKSLKTGSQLDYITIQEIKNIVEKNPKKLWLGKGFVWSQDQSQKMYDILRAGPDKVLPPESLYKGYQWFHGLGVPKDVLEDIDSFANHTIIAGTTGAGKTRVSDVLISQLIARDEALIIIDPKGDAELANNARLACEGIGKPDKYAYFHLAFPDKSVKIDPLKNFSQISELPDRIMKVVSNGETKHDPFGGFFWGVTNAITQGMVYLGERPTLHKILFYATSPTSVGELIIKAVKKLIEENIEFMPEDWEKRLKLAIKRSGDIEAKGYGTFYDEELKKISIFDRSEINSIWELYGRDAQHYRSMIDGVIPTLTQLTSDAARELLSPVPGLEDERRLLDMAKVEANNMCLYVGLNSLANSTVSTAVGAIMLADAASYAGNIYNYRRKEERKFINIYVDEAAEVVNAALIQILNKGRGAFFRVFLATQAFDDFVVRLGSEPRATQTLANLNNTIFFKIPEPKTQRHITDNLREVEIQRLDSQHSGGVNPDISAATRGNYGEKLDKEWKPLLAPWTLGFIPPLHGFYKSTNGELFKIKVPIIQY